MGDVHDYDGDDGGVWADAGEAENADTDDETSAGRGEGGLFRWFSSMNLLVLSSRPPSVPPPSWHPLFQYSKQNAFGLPNTMCFKLQWPPTA